MQTLAEFTLTDPGVSPLSSPLSASDRLANAPLEFWQCGVDEKKNEQLGLFCSVDRGDVETLALDGSYHAMTPLSRRLARGLTIVLDSRAHMDSAGENLRTAQE